jgi:hypothetical protein
LRVLEAYLAVSQFAKVIQVDVVRGHSAPQYGRMDDKTRRFLWLFLPFGLVIVAIGGYWLSAHSPRERDRSFAKDHPFAFLAANSAGEAMLQLDACLWQYALVQRDEAYPGGLERLGPDGIRCVNANLTGGPNNVNYRFAYFPAGRDAKEKPHGFLLYAYPLLGRDGKLVPDSTLAEYFANEDGVVLVRKDFGALTEHIEPFLGLPKTLQVLQRSLHFGQASANRPNGNPRRSWAGRYAAGVFQRATRIPRALDSG